MQRINGILQGKGKKFIIVVSRFNDFLTSRLLDGAVDALVRHEVSEDDITVIWVPGAFEIPSVVRLCAEQRSADGIVCIGAVIRGSTPHFDYVAAEVSKGIAQVGLTSEIPIGYGVLTCDTVDQGIERSGSKAGNKGADAALSVLELTDLYARMRNN